VSRDFLKLMVAVKSRSTSLYDTYTEIGNKQSYYMVNIRDK